MCADGGTQLRKSSIFIPISLYVNRDTTFVNKSTLSIFKEGQFFARVKRGKEKKEEKFKKPKECSERWQTGTISYQKCSRLTQLRYILWLPYKITVGCKHLYENSL